MPSKEDGWNAFSHSRWLKPRASYLFIANPNERYGTYFINLGTSMRAYSHQALTLIFCEQLISGF